MTVMTFADQIRVHQSRCNPHLLRLRFVARDEADMTITRQIAAEVRDATNAILVEAETAVRGALAAGADGRREPTAETLLWARLTRLASAADEAVNAARGGNASGLRIRLRRFDVLTSAIWTVQHAMYGHEPLPQSATRREARERVHPVPETVPPQRLPDEQVWITVGNQVRA